MRTAPLWAVLDREGRLRTKFFASSPAGPSDRSLQMLFGDEWPQMVCVPDPTMVR